MLRSGRQKLKAIQKWFAECHAFFDSTAKASSERNWATLHSMSVFYLIYPCVYLFVVCPILNIETQTAVVRIFTAMHAVFTLWVYLYGKKAPAPWVVDTAITLFAMQILGLSGFLAVAVFPTEASFLFPLCLVLMTLIYNRRLIYPILEVLIPSAVYLVFCGLTKSPYSFALDAISIFIAIGISGAALFTATSYKLQAYQSQLALQKMCALDPMTRVNNKPTFEFLAEDYIRTHPGRPHALAVCDLDDFKRINDTHGHRVGDAVLEAFAARLHGLSDGDAGLIAGRFGGDEFVLFLKEYDSEQQALMKLRELNNIPGFDFPVTCSIGLAFSPSGSADFQQYFDAADQSLYGAKSLHLGGIQTANADEKNGTPKARTGST